MATEISEPSLASVKTARPISGDPSTALPCQGQSISVSDRPSLGTEMPVFTKLTAPFLLLFCEGASLAAALQLAFFIENAETRVRTNQMDLGDRWLLVLSMLAGGLATNVMASVYLLAIKCSNRRDSFTFLPR